MMKTTLNEWHLTHTNNLPSRIDSLKNSISVLESKGEVEELSEEEVDGIHEMSAALFSLSRVNASILWQQARMSWLRERDANSKYFHAIMSSRRCRNVISSILVDGNRVEGVSEVQEAVFNHFQQHFASPNTHRPRAENLRFQMLYYEEGVSLTMPFGVDEIKEVVWDCESFKSPGPDGIHTGFIKDFWPELKDDILRFMTQFHRNGRLSKGINSTFIALIPKVDSLQSLNEFRPIALVGILYKILAKILANCLRKVMISVIAETQTTFVKDRQIMDGILIANEVVDESRKLKKDLLLFKVDFEKAYDSIDWGYLDDVLRRMAFPTLWRKWMKECVGSAIASILVNGSPTNEFPLKRGLRQGDPLSPFHFLNVAEGLNVLMTAAMEANLFTGYSVGSTNPIVISHLQFADDTLLMGVKSWANGRTLRAVLFLFEAMSGLKVNFHKSMLFGVNIDESWVHEATSVMSCKIGRLPFIYLGLPIFGDPRRLVFWEPVLDRIKARLFEWKSRNLSFGGHLILLKSVLSSLPVYALSFFKAPSGIIFFLSLF